MSFSRLFASIGLIVLSLTLVPAYAQKPSLAQLFDMTEIRDESSLKTVIASDTLRPSTVRAGKKVRVIDLSFTSQTWKESDWKHPTRIYVPEGYDGKGAAGIIATERLFFDTPLGTYPRHTISGTGLGTEAEYAEGTAIDLGLPIMIFSNPPEDYWGLGESDMTGFALKKALETRDSTWMGYYPIIKAYLRAITLMHSLPGVGTQQAVLMGCSKRGFSVSAATAVDPDRVAGVMATCYFGGNILYFIAKKFAEFGAAVGGPAVQRDGPGYQPPEALLRAFNSPYGLQLLAQYDPYMWRTQIKPKFFVALGTNDEFYGLGSANSMMEEMKGDKAFLAVDNVKHSWVSDKHLSSWRMWLAHTFFGRSIAKIQSKGKIDAGQLKVNAKVQAENLPISVNLFFALNNQGTDWRKAEWRSIPMNLSDGTYAASLPVPPGQAVGYYVEVKDTGRGGPGYVSSLVETAVSH